MWEDVTRIARDGTDAIIEPSRTEEWFGQPVTQVGDLDGDGYGDLLIGAPRGDVDGTVDCGAIHVFFGPFDGQVTADDADLVLSGGAEAQWYDWIGYGFSGNVDIDGDGFADGIAGIPYIAVDDAEDAGRVYIINSALVTRQSGCNCVVVGDRCGKGAAGTWRTHSVLVLAMLVVVWWRSRRPRLAHSQSTT